MNTAERSTLVGVATGTPDGGVAIVRLSGPRAGALAVAVAGPLPSPRRLVRVALALGEGEHEDALLVWMPGPRSFTGEDVVEFHVHGGARNVDAVVGVLLERGATAAGRGDFSRRAFELGRMGLDEAEGIAAIIGAKTDAALAQARRLAGGELGKAVEELRRSLVVLCAAIEANLDFPEDVDPADVGRWHAEATAARGAVADWLRRFEAGRRARSVARVVLAGPPNAGKSSLFNALLGRARALVADAPGTTRDFVEAPLAVDGYGCVLVDTAGLREGAEAVERAGVALSREQMGGADVVIWVEAADAPSTEDVSLDEVAGATIVRVESKRDTGTTRASWLGVSLAHGEASGVEDVREALRSWFRAGQDQAWIGLARHRSRAEEAVAAIDEALGHLADDQTLELAAFALGVAQTRLGEINGRSAMGVIGEEVMAEIFARFCIGK